MMEVEMQLINSRLDTIGFDELHKKKSKENDHNAKNDAEDVTIDVKMMSEIRLQNQPPTLQQQKGNCPNWSIIWTFPEKILPLEIPPLGR